LYNTGLQFAHIICTHCLLAVLLQSIIEDDDIKLDWFFKVSLINDIVKVNNSDMWQICLYSDEDIERTLIYDLAELRGNEYGVLTTVLLQAKRSVSLYHSKPTSNCRATIACILGLPKIGTLPKLVSNLAKSQNLVLK